MMGTGLVLSQGKFELSLNIGSVLVMDSRRILFYKTYFSTIQSYCHASSCGNVNFARRTACNRCNAERPTDGLPPGKKKLGVEIGKNAAEKSKGLFAAEDWQCSKCGNVNWARRTTCNGKYNAYLVKISKMLVFKTTTPPMVKHYDIFTF